MTVAQEVTYLDHHQGAADELENARGVCREKAIPAYIKFDNEHSGCVLAWEHYITEATCEPVPPVLACVEDRDLWRFRMPETKAVCANIYSYPMTMSAWDQIAARPFEDVADGGIDILRAHDKNVARFQEALEFFNQSLAVGQYNQATKADAYFWRGESNYRLDR